MSSSVNTTNPKHKDGDFGAHYEWAGAINVSITQSPRSNWEAHMYGELVQALFRMSRLPEEHELFLESRVSKKAAEVLSLIQSNTRLAPPRLINEEGDTVLFSWLDANIKKYLCIDEDEIELEARKLGTRQHCREVVLADGSVEVEKILHAIGSTERNSSKV